MENLVKRIIRKIKWIFRKRHIPELTEKRNLLERYRQIYQPVALVETGTFMGDTIEFFKDKFKSIYSIELSAELAARAAGRFCKDRHVQIIQGDSGEKLGTILNNLKGTSLFWLDGHYSSEFYLNGEFIQTAKAAKETPIEKELELLLSSGIIHIIFIDDARLFKGNDDYPSIKTIREMVKKRGNKYKVFVKKDIIHLLPL
jgi:hypothetical protein